jgi:preprotein translocase subunit SecF
MIEPRQADSPVYWFLMQIGMIAGFITSWPVNAWLIRSASRKPCDRCTRVREL